MSLPPLAMSVTEAIAGRRSVRAFEPTPLDRSTLQTLLEAAVRAPTAMHEEPWQFVVVQDRDRLQWLSARAKAFLSAEVRRLHPERHLDPLAQPDFNVFYDAGTLVIICAPADRPFAVADCWLAAQNLMLVAHAMGLGTCVIGSAVHTLNEPEVKQDLGIPADTTAVAPLIVGVPRGTTAPSARQPPRIVAWR